MPVHGYEFYFQVFNLISHKWMTYQVEHEKIKLISTSGHVIFCLLHKHTIDDVFGDFPKIPTTFRRFPKIFQNCSEGLTNVSEHFLNIFRRLPKISKEDWWFFNHTTPPLSTIKRLCSYNNGNLKTCVNNLLISHVKISCYLHVWRYHVYARKLTWYFAGVYIINMYMPLTSSIYILKQKKQLTVW